MFNDIFKSMWIMSEKGKIVKKGLVVKPIFFLKIKLILVVKYVGNI